MPDRVFVGRQRELQELRGCLDRALSGKGQVCFVTGEAGSGKTFLVQHFPEQALAADERLVAATGACNAQNGISDPYLPFRETLACSPARRRRGTRQSGHRRRMPVGCGQWWPVLSRY